MGILNKLFGRKETQNISINFSNFGSNEGCDYEKNKKFIEERINEFKEKYDLSSIEGIRAIPIQEARKYPDGGISVVYMPEQILSRQATEYKKSMI